MDDNEFAKELVLRGDVEFRQKWALQRARVALHIAREALLAELHTPPGEQAVATLAASLYRTPYLT